MKSHVLLIETDQTVIRCFTNAFVKNDYPYKCTCAENINHARQIIDFLVPDFMFINLDQNIGGTLEFVAALRKVPEFRKIKIVLYSKLSSYYQCITKAYGAHLCIESPTDNSAIYDAINSFNIHTLAKS